MKEVIRRIFRITLAFEDPLVKFMQNLCIRCNYGFIQHVFIEKNAIRYSFVSGFLMNVIIIHSRVYES